jgi:hypothetical protein
VKIIRLRGDKQSKYSVVGCGEGGDAHGAPLQLSFYPGVKMLCRLAKTCSGEIAARQ